MIIIPPVTESKYFGTINKCLWFDVPNNRNPFYVSMKITPSQFSATQIKVLNRFVLPSNPEFTENFSLSPRPAAQTRNININHIPSLKAVEYVITNERI